MLVDALSQPVHSLSFELPNGTVIEQVVEYDFFPVFCASCRRMGHPAATCSFSNPNRGTSNPLGTERLSLRLMQMAGLRFKAEKRN